MKKNRENEQLALKGTEDEEILNRLSERVEKAIAAITQLRKERESLRERLETAEAKLREREEEAGRLSSMAGEQEQIRAERSEIRERIENILHSLERLEDLAETEAE